MRSARAAQREHALAERDLDLAGDLGVERREHWRAAASPSRRTSARCAGSAATRTRAPRENPRARRNACSPISISAPTGSSGSASAKVLVNSPSAPWMTVPRSAAPGGSVDGVERAQLENVLGVDRVGIAQPALDLGDRQRCRPRGARRLRRGLVDALDLGGLIERARPGEIALAAFARAASSALRRRPRRAAARSATPPSARRASLAG